MKSILVAGLLLSSASAAVAGPYANVENNAAFVDGGEFSTAVTEVHVGIESENGFYLQGGPAFVSVEGEDIQTEYSGKVGVVAGVTDKLDIYGEVAFLTEEQSFEVDELNVATKLGVKYAF